MICEVSRLLAEDTDDPDEQDWSNNDKKGMRVADLLSLIEAVTLHDTLYTLPAKIDTETENLNLHSELMMRGIVQELDTSSVHELLAKSILTALSQIKSPVRVAGSASDIGTPIDFPSQIRHDIAEFLLISDNPTHENRSPTLQSSEEVRGSPRLDDSYDFFEEGGGSSMALYASSLEECGRALIGWIEYHYSGAYEHCTSILRDMYYVLAAETFELPYWPQTARRHFTAQFPNYFEKKTLLQLYSQLAKEFKSTVTDVYDDHKEELAFVPPFASLVLSRSGSPQEIVMRTLEVRDEYADLRHRLSDLQAERIEARTIAARLKLRKRQRYLLNEVASAFDRPSVINLEGVIRYVPQVIKPAIKPADPTSYSADLLILPVKQLINWWRRRPISKFFVLADKLKNTEDYPSLIKRVFGEEVYLPGSSEPW
jgi:hypothetical protein